jgi:hypothetical protein
LGVVCYSAPLTGAGCVIFPVAIMVARYYLQYLLLCENDEHSFEPSEFHDSIFSQPSELMSDRGVSGE